MRPPGFDLLFRFVMADRGDPNYFLQGDNVVNVEPTAVDTLGE